jgi:Ser/Thr protein kinase RdoA (MazF antagonist)
VQHGPWFALVTQDVDGRQPTVPWRDDELDLVLAALGRLAEALTPAPAMVATTPAIADYLGADFTGWRALAKSPGDDRLDPWSRARLGELAALEATWTAHAAGSTLLHADIRADNLLLTDDAGAGDRVMVVDWPHACRGAAFVDLVGFAPSVAMQGGPPACRAAGQVPGRAQRQPRVAGGGGLRAGRLLHRALAPAAAAWIADGAPVPGRAG